MNDPLRIHLLDLGASYAETTKVSLSAVCRDVLKDSTFSKRLERHGTRFTNGTYLRLVAWFSLKWPAQTEWPVDVRRMGRTEAEAMLAATEPKKRSRSASPDRSVAA
jgi:hypothetical protein